MACLRTCQNELCFLQGFAQIPDLTVWYGPDTYMGRNLAQLFTSLAEQPDEEVQKLHPGHTQASVKALLPRLHYFQEGICVVHHIFGGEVTELVRKAYGDAYLTAHFEVGLLFFPGPRHHLAHPHTLPGKTPGNNKLLPKD